MKRRELLRRAGLAAATIAATGASRAHAGAPNEVSAPSPGGRVPISLGIHPQDALQAKRTSRVESEIAASLGKKGARPVRVAAYQMRNHCGGEEGKRHNLERMLSAIEQGQSEGVQLMAFPEMCLQGYFTPASGSAEEAARANKALADTITGSNYLKTLRDAAAAARMALVFGFAEMAGNRVYNSAGIIDADGRWLGVRRKNPLFPWPYELDSFSEPDRDGRSAVFDTAVGRIGVSVCFDGEFAESIRQMRVDGAELLVWINAACGDSKLGSAHRINAAGAYAEENYFWVVCCNCAAPDSSGTSCIHSPSGEPLVILSPNEEQFGIAIINLAMNADWSMWKDRVVRRVKRQRRN